MSKSFFFLQNNLQSNKVKHCYHAHNLFLQLHLVRKLYMWNILIKTLFISYHYGHQTNDEKLVVQSLTLTNLLLILKEKNKNFVSK